MTVPLSSNSERLRERANDLRWAGATIREIADELGVSHSTVGDWLKDDAPPPLADVTRIGRRGGGERYSNEIKAEARWLRSKGLGCPTIARRLGVSLRSAQVWTADIAAALVRACEHCGRDFEQPADPGGPKLYCSDLCVRYSFALRRPSRRAA